MVVSRRLGLVVMLCAALSATPAEGKSGPTVIDIVRSADSSELISKRLLRYPEVDLGVPAERVPAAIKAMLGPLKRAVDSLDRVYWQQVSHDGLGLLAKLDESKAKAAADLARYMRIHYGVWDRHDDDAPFIGQRSRPAGAAFYPPDLSRREFEGYVNQHPEKARGLWSPYTVVSRNGDGLVAVPYSKAYKQDLKAAGVALREAAAAYQCSAPASSAAPATGLPAKHPCPCANLARFLEGRAESFDSDDYRSSEYLWMDSQACPLDVAIGPYEYYEDRLVGLKTAFMGIVSLRDDAESARFRKLLEHADGLFANLPVPAAVRRRFERTMPSPITIADVLYTAGDARAGYQIRAYLLPNDEAVRRARGTKNVILRNAVRAKFDKLTKPVAKSIFSAKDLKSLSFDAYFDILLTWQLAHSVVPGKITLPGGATTTARQLLRERNPIVDMVKGEVMALVNYFYLLDKGVLSNKDEGKLAVTYLAQLFDSARLAASAPQTVAKTIIYNYLAREWVVRYDPRGQTFEVNPPALRQAVRKLAAETLEILARGDYDGAGRLIVEYGIMPAEMRAKMQELGDLPLDIWPRYTSLATK